MKILMAIGSKEIERLLRNLLELDHNDVCIAKDEGELRKQLNRARTTKRKENQTAENIGLFDLIIIDDKVIGSVCYDIVQWILEIDTNQKMIITCNSVTAHSRLGAQLLQRDHHVRFLEKPFEYEQIIALARSLENYDDIHYNVAISLGYKAS